MWHELGNDSYLNVAAHVNDYRAVERSLGISPAADLDQRVRRRRARSTSRASRCTTWPSSSGTASAPPSAPTGTRPARSTACCTTTRRPHRTGPTSGTATMAGNIVQTIPGSWLDGVASYDPTRRFVNVVFGGDSGNNTVRVNGLGALGSQVRVTLSRTDTTGPLHQPGARRPPSRTATYTVSNGSISVPVNGMDALAALPAAHHRRPAACPTWQQRYEAENATVVNANRFTSSRPPTAATSARSTARRHRATSLRRLPRQRADRPGLHDEHRLRQRHRRDGDARPGLQRRRVDARSATRRPLRWGAFGSTVSTTVTLQAGWNVIRLAKGAPQLRRRHRLRRTGLPAPELIRTRTGAGAHPRDPAPVHGRFSGCPGSVPSPSAMWPRWPGSRWAPSPRRSTGAARCGPTPSTGSARPPSSSTSGPARRPASLHAGRTYTVGMITTDTIGRFSIPLLIGAEDTLGAGQISVLLCDARDDADPRAAPPAGPAQPPGRRHHRDRPPGRDPAADRRQPRRARRLRVPGLGRPGGLLGRPGRGRRRPPGRGAPAGRRAAGGSRTSPARNTTTPPGSGPRRPPRAWRRPAPPW